MDVAEQKNISPTPHPTNIAPIIPVVKSIFGFSPFARF